MIRLWAEVLTLFTIYHARTRYVSIAMAAVFTFAVIPLGTLGQARESDSGDPQQQIRELRALVIALQHRLEKLENPKAPADQDANSTPAGDAAVALHSASQELKTSAAPAFTKEDRATLDFLNGTTFNVGIDGYYEYNFNAPIGRVNLLRAYDVTSNSFNINQASLIIEHAANPLAGQRYGARIDLQYGQATETLQGGAQNELRPQVWRNLFQAYGTYVFPLGSGLTVDFGKWASSLGVEGNYTKDQINYSRAYLFNFLPFYHMGMRATYNLTPKVNAGYWLVNGAQQTEAFSGFKSQAFVTTYKPNQTVTLTANYFFGQQGRDTNTVLNPGFPSGPTQPGLPTTNISPAPDGREHIFDSYVTWSATPKLTLVGEGDYVINRLYAHSSPAHVSAGAAYARYQLTPEYAVGGRTEYLSDRGGLFSGKTQALKEITFTLERKFAEGFLMRAEYRRDFSNIPFFLTDKAGVLHNAQNTATLGMVWWAGQKQGSW